jgi:hypothetical protein
MRRCMALICHNEPDARVFISDTFPSLRRRSEADTPLVSSVPPDAVMGALHERGRDALAK